MSLKPELPTGEQVIDQIAGITGFGWSASLLGYLSAAVGKGVPLVTSPQSLLYLGGVCFVTTLGLDRLKRADSEESERESA